MASQSIDELKIELEYEAGQANSSVKELKDTLTQLSASTTGITSKLNNISKSLGNFKTAMTDLDTSAYAQNVAQIAQALVPLQNLGKSNLGSFVNQLKKIPDLNKSLDANTIQEFTTKINQLSAALSPLANELNTVSVAFSRLPNYLSKTNSKLNKYNVVANKTSAINSKLNFAGIVYGIRKFNDMLSGFITASNSYVENLNLFTVAMGANTDKALEWIGTIEQALGIDPSEMMRYMGVFQMITSGFGLSSDAAYKMSKNLTQLTYDISSFYNIGIEEAALKVQSAISGELEPVRRLGYALDQATLQQVAYNNGIEESYTQMTQAEKAQLRYIALLTQNQQVQGDMGRTIMSAANSIRILKQQMNILGREIGNIFIPMLMKIIPVAIAVVKVLTKVAKTIASLFGFQLPDLNWDTITEGSSGLASDMDDAVGSAKEFKKQLQGFDELNLLTSPSAGGSGTEDIGAGFELDLPEYDMLEGFTGGIEDLTKKIEKFFGITEDGSGKVSWSFFDMDEKAQALAITLGALAGIKLFVGTMSTVKNVIDGLTTLKTLMKSSVFKKTIGITVAVTGVTLMIDGITKLMEDPKNKLAIAEVLGGVLTSGVGIGMTFGIQAGLIATLVTASIGIGAGIATNFEDFFPTVSKIFADKYGESWDEQTKTFKFGVNLQMVVAGMAVGLIDLLPGIDEQQATQYLLNVGDMISAVAKLVNIFDVETFTKSWGVVGKAVIKTAKDTWTEFLEWWKTQALYKWWTEDVTPWFTKERWQQLVEDVKEAVTSKFKEWLEKFEIVKNWWDEKVAPWFTKEKWGEVTDNAKQSVSNKLSEWKDKFDIIGNWWNEKVAPWFTTSKWSEIATNAKTGIETKLNEWKNMFNPIKDWWDNKVAPWFTKEKWSSVATDAIDGIKSTFDGADFKIKMPHFTWTTTPVSSGWMYDILSNLGLPTSIPKLNVSWYADGGFPDTGEFFIAREAGPEMVGRIGNKTTVANNDQIVEGISAGVYEAVVSANVSNPNMVQVNLGNKTLYNGFTNGLRGENNRYGVAVVEV